MSEPSFLPEARAYRLRNARVPAAFLTGGVPAGAILDADGCALIDIVVADGAFAGLIPAGGSPEALPAADLAGRQVWPRLVDAHTHLDKGHTVARTPNPDGDFPGARDATTADRTRYWDAEDLRRRMDFGLACAFAHGTGAIRTHLDSQESGGEEGAPRDQAVTSWAVFREMRAAWAGRIALQAVGLTPIDAYATDYGRRLADLIADSDGLIGGVTRPTGGLHGGALAEIDALLDRLFGLARERGLDVDLHVDETGDPAATSLDAVARATLRHGYEGRVTCGHCCSLALQPEAQASATIARVAQAGIRVVTLPTVNMYLQDRRRGRTPRWRGVAPVQELMAAGVPVMVAGDNCRDAFYAYGDHDMLDTVRAAVRILHLDHPLAGAPALAGPVPGAMMGLPHAGTLREGGPADLILLPARSLNEVVARPHAGRIVVVAGRPITAPLPPYESLTGEAAPW
ncbi:cytosine deaminase [Methylorubrum rhodesianum]|uniref:Cytosine deaminase n=1 Tax=Methylorubrum rhodesianum TaxID=29427 RepID=A0ABU9ZAD0_9HYPH|nr:MULTISPECIES: cytosine deaminase [Methylorubrum]MBB5762479.1 cytosine deaminase [Methylorubrum rhodesianum]MBI1688685.1 cytosine deaminase [Methylorubrum sp. DB1722]MBK3404904.1 cytosine deaminase [Methylorubrum rhodesianum]MBY0142664.1 cytosine deaminase [Methylorubrum populi]